MRTVHPYIGTAISGYIMRFQRAPGFQTVQPRVTYTEWLRGLSCFATAVLRLLRVGGHRGECCVCLVRKQPAEETACKAVRT